MKAIILAAGTGSRLVHLTRDLPKALVEVSGKPLVQHTLEFSEALDCDEVIVVGGFYYGKLRSHLDQLNLPNLSIVENENYLKGSIFTLLAALDRVDESFFLMNVDHLYPLRLAGKIPSPANELNEITAFVDFDRFLHEDDMKVQVGPDQTIRRIAKELREFDAGYIGLTWVPEHRLQKYKEIALRISRENESAVVENILQMFVSEAQFPRIHDITGTPWLEVDNLWDLKNAERILRWVDGFLR